MVDSPQIFKGVCSKVFLIDGIKKKLKLCQNEIGPIQHVTVSFK